MSIQDLYYYIIKEYGERGAWISDIARNLSISTKSANYLTYSIGYRRGKALPTLKSETEFSCDAHVKLIHALIKYGKNYG